MRLFNGDIDMPDILARHYRVLQARLAQRAGQTDYYFAGLACGLASPPALWCSLRSVFAFFNWAS
jgi:hypothetical protein